MAKENRQYTSITRDADTISALDALLGKQELRELSSNNTEVPTMGQTLLAWAVQSVNSSVDSILEYEVTEGGHAQGKSISGAGEPTPTEGEAEVSDHYVRPNGQKYFHRPWGPTFNDVEVLRKARTDNLFPFLYGPPGTGKTVMAEAAYGEDLITFLGTGDTELADLVGSYIPDADGNYVWIDGPLLQAAEQGKVLLLDEIGIIDPKILTVVYSFMDGRGEYNVTANPARGIVKAKPGFFIIGATNPNAPGVRISEALISRFPVQVEVTTDYAMAVRMGIDKDIVAMAKGLDNQARQGEIEWAPQFRELLAFHSVSRVFGQKFAIENLIAGAPESMRPIVVANIAKGRLGTAYMPAQIR